MKRLTSILIAGWFVCTYGGTPVAGPFDIISECAKVAKVMAEQNPQISTVCQYKR